jgi:hypothetical protein
MNEQQMKETLAPITFLERKVAQLEAELTKARGSKPTLKASVREAVTKAIAPAANPAAAGHAAAGRQPDVSAAHAALEADPPAALVARRRREAEAEREFEAKRAAVRRRLNGEE